MKSLYQKGSAHVLVTVGLVVIILGLVGYIAWQQLTSSDDTPNESTVSETTSPTTTDEAELNEDTGFDQAYVTSFDMPDGWSSTTSGEIMCQTYNFCTSGPVLLIDNGQEKMDVKLTLHIPQSASDATIDEEAASYKDMYTVTSIEKSTLDGLETREIHTSGGITYVIFDMRGGYGSIMLDNVTDVEKDILFSNWQWS